jgi:hypothetical protein
VVQGCNITYITWSHGIDVNLGDKPRKLRISEDIPTPLAAALERSDAC